MSNLILRRNIWQKPIKGARIDLKHPLSQNLVGLWIFNENTGLPYGLINLTTPDKIGDPTWNGLSMHFDGENDGVNTNQQIDLSQNGFSISVLARRESGGATSLFSTFNEAGSETNIYFRIGNSCGFKGSTWRSVDTSYFVNDIWAWYTLDFNLATLRYYFNGLVKGTTDTTDTVQNHDFAYHIGQLGYYTSTQRWKGNIAYVIVHDKYISTDLIKEIQKYPYSLIKSPNTRKIFITVTDLNLSTSEDISVIEGNAEDLKIIRIDANISESLGVSESSTVSIESESNLISVTRKSTWQKPPRGATINWTHPLSRGLIHSWLFNEGGGSPVDLVTQEKSIASGGPVWSPGYMHFDEEDSHLDLLQNPPALNDFTFTYLARINFFGDGIWNRVFEHARYDTGFAVTRYVGSSTEFRLRFQSTPRTLTPKFGELGLWIVKRKESIGYFEWHSAEGSNINIRKTYTVGTVPLGSTHSLRLNEYTLVDGYNLNQDVYAVNYYDRALTVDEITSLLHVPYQFLHSPYTRKIFVSPFYLSTLFVETISAVDSSEEDLNLIRLKANISESLGITESSTIPITPLSTQIDEILGLLENLKIVITPSLKQAIESISIAENISSSIQTLLYHIATSENIALLENLSLSLKTILFKISQNESISIADIANFTTQTRPVTVNIFDSLSILDNIQTDILTLLFHISEAENINISESILSELSGAGDANLIDNVSVLDNISTLLTRILRDISRSESIAVSESITLLISSILFQISSYDLIGLIESVTVELKSILYKVDNSENILVTDYPIIQSVDVSDLAVNLSEIIGVIDKIFVALDSFRTSVFDTISIAEFKNVALTPISTLLVETVAVSEFIKIISPLLQVNQTESISLQESISSILRELTIHSSETILIIDNLQLLLNPLVDVSFESISLQDLLTISLQLQDRIDLSETINVTEGIFVSNKDTVSTYLRRYLGDVIKPATPKQVQDIVDVTVDSDLEKYLRRYLGDIK